MKKFVELIGNFIKKTFRIIPFSNPISYHQSTCQYKNGIVTATTYNADLLIYVTTFNDCKNKKLN